MTVTTEETCLRAIRPGDLPAVAEVHRAAFPDSVLTLLGRETVRRYYEWQLLGPHDVCALGSFVDGILAGFCFCGRFRGALRGYLRKNRMFLAVALMTQPWLLVQPACRRQLRQGLRSLLSTPNHGDGGQTRDKRSRLTFGILAIAVHTKHQGKGVGYALMNEAEREARARGAEEMRLTVDPKNHRAVKFYQRNDWQKTLTNGEWKGEMKRFCSSV